MLLYEYQLHVAAGLSPEPRRLLAELYEHDRCSVNWDLIAEEQQVWPSSRTSSMNHRSAPG
jgi:hypothetical protein